MSYLSGRAAGLLSGVSDGALSGFARWPIYSGLLGGAGATLDQRQIYPLGRAPGIDAEQDLAPYGHRNSSELAAAGDLVCEGYINASRGGRPLCGSTATYRIFNRNLCESCAVKALGLTDGESAGEKTKALAPYLIGR
jgi:hypothetical protein